MLYIMQHVYRYDDIIPYIIMRVHTENNNKIRH